MPFEIDKVELTFPTILDDEYRFLIIKQHPLFASFSQQDLMALTHSMVETTFKSDEKIVVENDFVDSIYFIVKGRAKVIQKTTIDGLENQELIIGFLEIGDVIGLNDTGFFSSGGRRTATVTAISDMHLLCLNLKELHQFIKLHSKHFDEKIQELSKSLIKLNFIKRAYPFAHLNNDMIYEISNDIKEINLPEKTMLFYKNEAADCCYLIQKGEVEIFITQPDGTEKQLAILQTAKIVGETALLTRGERNASARTLTEAKLLVIERSLLYKLMKANSEFAESVIGFMLNRIRPYRNIDVKEHRRKTKDGQILINLQNLISNEYFQLNESTLFIWELLDGIQSIRELTIAYFNKFKVFAPELICELVYSLAEAGFVTIPSINVEYAEKEEVITETSGRKILVYLKSLTQREFSLKTDAFLTATYQKVMWVFFTPPAYLLFSLIALGGFFLLLESYPHVLNRASHSNLHLSLFILAMVPISAINVFAHEAGHAYTAKKFGFRVPRIGVGWYFLAPIAFTDTTELWIANQKERIAVDVAGVFVDAIVGGLFAILAFNLNNIASIYCWLFSVFIYFNAFKNLSPIKEYDGYYLLNDLFDTYLLRKRSLMWLTTNLPLLFKTPFQFKQHSDQIFYWLACFIYIILFSWFLFLILKTMLIIFKLDRLLHVNAALLSGILVSIIIALSITGMIVEIKRFKKYQIKQ